MKRKTKKPAKNAGPSVELIEGRYYTRGANGKLIMDGHQLNAMQEGEFCEKVRERLAIARRQGSNIDDPHEYAHRVALSDLLFSYRPTRQAEHLLLDLGSELSHAASAIQSVRDFAFYGESVFNDHASQLVQKLVAEAERRTARLRHYADSMVLESSTKLHHWTSRQEKLARI